MTENLGHEVTIALNTSVLSIEQLETIFLGSFVGKSCAIGPFGMHGYFVLALSALF